MFEIKQNTHTQTLRFDVYPMVTSSFFLIKKNYGNKMELNKIKRRRKWQEMKNSG